MKIKILAAVALVTTSFTPVALPGMISAASAAPLGDATRCVAAARALPNPKWSWAFSYDVLSSVTTPGETTASFANRVGPNSGGVTHADKTTTVAPGSTVTTYRVNCEARNPADNYNLDHSTSYTVEETVGGGEPTITTDHVAICNSQHEDLNGYDNSLGAC